MWYKNILAVALTLTSLHAFSADNAQIQQADSLVLPQLTDQFDQKQSLLPETRWVVFTHDMGGGDLVKQVFEEQTKETLLAAGIQYYADISGMPGVISRFIAIPKMQDLPYSLVLGRDEEQLSMVPRQDDQVTVIGVADGKVISIQMVDNADALSSMVFSAP